MVEARVGVIGGTGLYDLDGLRNVREAWPETPFGATSDSILLGELQDVTVAFMPRHGRGHRLNPTEIPSRANVYAFKTLGVERLISVGAVGSLAEEVRPLDLVTPTQLIDRTFGRPATFFEDGVVAHISFADPFCPHLSGLVATAAQAVGATLHQTGTYLVMEGPAFSTRAESAMYRSWGATIIGMTALPEAKLAREAEMCYTFLASVTDYDVWHPGHDDVTVDLILGNLRQNVQVSKRLLQQLIPAIPKERHCACGAALKDAIATAPQYIKPEAKQRLAPLLQKYVRT